MGLQLNPKEDNQVLTQSSICGRKVTERHPLRKRSLILSKVDKRKEKTARKPSAPYATAAATTTRATKAMAAASNYGGTTEPTNDYSFGKIWAKELKAIQ